MSSAREICGAWPLLLAEELGHSTACESDHGSSGRAARSCESRRSTEPLLLSDEQLDLFEVEFLL